MKNNSSIISSGCRIRLEPALEIQAVTFDEAQCLSLAATYERWAHQLRVKAAILKRDAQPRPKRKRLRKVRPSVLLWN